MKTIIHITEYLMFNAISRVLTLILFCIPTMVHSQSNDRMTLTSRLEPKEVVAGEKVTLKLKLTIQPGFHTYPTVQADPNAKNFTTNIRVKSGPLEADGTAKGPKAKEKFDPDLKATVAYYVGDTEIEVPLKVKAGTSPGRVKIVIRIQTQVCDDNSCLPFVESLEFELNVKSAG